MKRQAAEKCATEIKIVTKQYFDKNFRYLIFKVGHIRINVPHDPSFFRRNSIISHFKLCRSQRI